MLSVEFTLQGPQTQKHKAHPPGELGQNTKTQISGYYCNTSWTSSCPGWRPKAWSHLAWSPAGEAKTQKHKTHALRARLKHKNTKRQNTAGGQTCHTHLRLRARPARVGARAGPSSFVRPQEPERCPAFSTFTDSSQVHSFTGTFPNFPFDEN